MKKPLIHHTLGLLLVQTMLGCAPETPAIEAPGATPQGGESAFGEPTWTPVQKMRAPRTRHAATWLSAERALLVTGGDDNTPSTAELYYPAINGWRATDSFMRARRSGHTATKLDDGRVLITGGDGPLTSAEIYDPSTRAFSDAPHLTKARSNHTATRLLDGRVLITGGLTAGGLTEDSAEIFDGTAFIDAPSPMTTPRRSHVATLLLDGRVLITGGIQQGPTDGGMMDVSLASAEVFDPATGTFTPVSPMSEKRGVHTATRLLDDRVLIVGGGSDLFDPKTGTFTKGADLKQARSNHTATLLPSGDVLVAGGSDLGKSSEAFAFATGNWVRLAIMVDQRSEHAAARLDDEDAHRPGPILITGGKSPGVARIASAEMYSIGLPCSIDEDCTNGGACRGGVCCAIACHACYSCIAPAAPGVCAPVSRGEDPRCDCEGRDVPGVSPVCYDAYCSDDTHAVPARACPELPCLPSPPSDCAPLRCQEGACLRRCQSIHDCAPGFACDPNGACVEPPPNEVTRCSPAPAPPESSFLAAALAGALALAARRISASRRGRR